MTWQHWFLPSFFNQSFDNVSSSPSFLNRSFDNGSYCARRDRDVHQRINANGLLPCDLFSWNKANKAVRYLNVVSQTLLLFTHKWYCTQWLNTLCTMGLLCHVWLFSQSSYLLHESVTPSSAADQLLILLLIWRVGPSPIPPQVDPISLRLQAPSRFFVGYSYNPSFLNWSFDYVSSSPSFFNRSFDYVGSSPSLLTNHSTAH
jgi:hypothetical protein